MNFLSILLVVAVILIVAVVILFNQLVNLRQMVRNGWSDIDVQLKRRTDLIPQLVKTVKGYAKHEKQLFSDITKKRSQSIDAGNDIKARQAAEGALARPISRLLAVAEDYPELKANQNFLDLQNELSETEDKIEMARRFFNGATRELNTKVESFPANLVAGAFNFHTVDYFELEGSDGALPDIAFGDNA
ncbi:MAG: LemA family protein [Acidimicrobiales bacterium]|nr:LemA family protein [Hyphomonadaceae bacterium]RZV44191.1 MAG: LemA family protein [Acidimicrobiales bacterium]